MEKAVFLYVPCPDKKTAKNIARVLLDEGLVGCVNFFPVENMYYWDNKRESGKEIIMLIKSIKSSVKKVRKNILELHPYDIPCIAEIPVTVNEDFLHWLESSHHHL